MYYETSDSLSGSRRLSRPALQRVLRLVLPAAAAMAAFAAPAQTKWPANLFNPQAQPDDLVLPMPCGGSMAFRRVNVPAADALDDRRVQIGNADQRFAYAENSRSEYVGGGFTDTKQKSQRYFLMAKYELTTLQYEALSGKCPAVSEDGRMPKTGLTWAEAVSYTAQYAGWLARNGGAAVPSEDGSQSFVRLPTEGEWEFAARGGVAVADAVFEQPAFPMPDGPQRYVWYAGTDSSNNELNGIGLLKPNPLGLHDMLGNAGEFVMDPFRLNKHSRMHGQAGGYTVKGGDFRTAMSDIRAASRTEYSPVDKSGERRDKAIGIRLVVVPPSLTTPQRLQSVRGLWTAAAQAGPGPAGQPLADPAKEVEALAKAVTDPALKSRIEGVGTVIKASVQARNEQRDRSAKSEIRVGAYLINKLLEDGRRLNAQKAYAETAKGLGPQFSKDAEANVKSSTEAIDVTLNYAIDTLKQIGLDFPTPSITAQGEVLKREFEARSVQGYGPLIDLVVKLSQSARNGKPIEKPALLAEVAKLNVPGSKK